MQQLRFQHGQRPPVLPQLRRQALSGSSSPGWLRQLRRGLIGLLACAALLLAWSLPASAAQVLQVRQGTLLQVGDSNRSYAVQLGCVVVSPEHDAAAVEWLRQALPRGTRVNLRPLGQQDGQLLARVQVVPRGGGAALDLGSGLVAAGLASATTAADCPPIA